MSRWQDRANGIAAYARSALAGTLWPLRRMLIAGTIGIVLSSSAGRRVVHCWKDTTVQAELDGLGDKAPFNC